MKKQLYLLALLCLSSFSAPAQTRHLIKTNILYNELPFSNERKVYLFNQYQFKLRDKWSIAVGYGNSKKSSVDPRLQTWLNNFGPEDSNTDFSNTEHYQNAEIAIAYNYLQNIPNSAIYIGLSAGNIWNTYDYKSNVQIFKTQLSQVSNVQRNTSLPYIGLNIEYAEIIKERLHLGLNLQFKFSQKGKLDEIESRYIAIDVPASLSITEEFTLAPIFGFSLGYYLN